jgi:CRISPR-associated protein Csh1
MQDKAIDAIGVLQLEKNKDLEPVDLYIENLFPGKDYQMLFLVFEIINNNGELKCEYKGIDIEKVSSEKEDYRKYAYRKGSSNGGDITFTTKLFIGKRDEVILNIRKKLPKIKNRYNEIKSFTNEKEKTIQEQSIFSSIAEEFSNNFYVIIRELINEINNWDRNENTIGITFMIKQNEKESFLRDFEIIKSLIFKSEATTKFINQNTKSLTHNKICSVSGKTEDEIYGFAAPFAYSTPDKQGFISGFFNKKLNWRNYPISSNEAFILEQGRKFIKQNLSGYFYGHEYMLVPHPIIKTYTEQLNKIINLLKTAFDEEKAAKKEKKKRAEDRIQRLIAEEDNYFILDIAFYKRVQSSMKIQLMLEEILPSRFRQLFIDVPETVNKNKLFKNAIKTKKEGYNDLKFSYQIIKIFFSSEFLDVVNKLFLGKKLSDKYVFENIIKIIRNNYNENKSSDNWVEPAIWTIKKAIMLISYLQELEIINYNKNYKYMEVENTQQKQSSFNLDGFNDFVKVNSSFLDSDVKVGVFALGVFVKLLFDIQARSLNTSSPPFENKLRGYKLNPDLLMNVYTEALDKIQKYLKNHYVYSELREVINQYFIVKSNELNKMTNNELSFYFVAGIELGKQFKNKDENENNK